MPVECFEADGSRKNLYKAARKASNKSIILTRLSLRNSRTPFDPPQARGVARGGLRVHEARCVPRVGVSSSNAVSFSF